MSESNINTRNAGNLSTYEIRYPALITCLLTEFMKSSQNISYHRQELVRRGAFDLDENAVCYSSLLKRLMRELVIDENVINSKRSSGVSEDAQIARDLSKQVRDEKKREAIERSKQRQSDPLYFERINEQNKKHVIEATDSTNDTSAVLDEIETFDDDTEKGSKEPFDPFRPTYSEKYQRSRVHVS